MSAKESRIPKILLKIVLAIILGISIYYLIEGASAVLTHPILAAITLPALLILIILGILSLLT